MTCAADATDRNRLGAWYTPPALVSRIVSEVVTADFLDRACGRPLRVLDPACGDGRFLAAVAAHAADHGVACRLHGVDIDPSAVERARGALFGAEIVEANALTYDWGEQRYDLVIGNPPFLSQMAAATTRGGASSRSGGPYADAAVEFLAMAGELVDPDGGRVAYVLPQSILAARDAGALRRTFAERSRMVWSWLASERVFDADVHTCALGFEFGPAGPSTGETNWSSVVTTRRGVPPLPSMHTTGRIGDVAVLNANFRDEYYGMVPAVGDHGRGPRLVTSGLIDPGRSRWGERTITFAKQRLSRPCVDLDALDHKMRAWAARRLVPKVLVANQTSIVEAVCDDAGAWLPAVPVIGIYPRPTDVGTIAEQAWEIAALLTSPVASAWCWHRCAGTGLSADAIRLGPAMLGDLPLPCGPLDPAVEALRAGDARSCGALVTAAYGLAGADDLLAWWERGLDRLERRSR